MKKVLLTSLSALLIVSSSLYAKKDKYDDDYNDEKYEKKYDKDYGKKHDHMKKNEYKKEKGYEKEKKLPYGMKKKMERDGELPPGWEKKVRRGQVLDESVFRHAEEIRHSKYKDIKNTKIYRVEDKIFRVIDNTREILEILK